MTLEKSRWLPPAYAAHCRKKPCGTSRTVATAPDYGLGGWYRYQVPFKAPQGGRVEAAILSAGTGCDVLFDDLSVRSRDGYVVQEQHFYPYGAPITGLSYAIGTHRYRHGYQGQYAENDTTTGYNSFELRLYDARIGRWFAPDPYGQYVSPYVGMGNNPVTGVDPDGGLAGPSFGFYLGAFIGGSIGFNKARKNGQDFVGVLMGTLVGAAAGGLYGELVNLVTTRGGKDMLFGLTRRVGEIEGLNVYKSAIMIGGALTLPNKGIFTGPYHDTWRSTQPEQYQQLLKHEYGHYLQKKNLVWDYGEEWLLVVS